MDRETGELNNVCDRCNATDGRDANGYTLPDKADRPIELCDECVGKYEEQGITLKSAGRGARRRQTETVDQGAQASEQKGDATASA
jgi:hypothetical protein